MQYVTGESLQALTERQEQEKGTLKLEMKLASHISCGILKGLKHLHSLDILHRDIKPANIMITPGTSVVLIDLGLSKVAGVGQTITATDACVGTHNYCSPEVLEAHAVKNDAQADVWAAGVVMFKMFSGKHPFCILQSDQDFRMIVKKMNGKVMKLEDTE